MLKDIINALEVWNANKNERQKLQYSYVVLAVLIIFAAGIISLFNSDLGHIVVLFGLASIMAFIVNGIVWNLLNSIILSKLASKPKKK